MPRSQNTTTNKPLGLEATAVTILLFILFTNILGASQLLLGIAVHQFTVPCALACSLLLVRYFYYSYFNFKLLLTVSVAIIASALLAPQLLDLSWDGQTYHQETIIQLQQGWIPHQTRVVLPPPDTGGSLWVNHYPQGAELFAAHIYTLTGNIETAKMGNLLWLIATMLLATSVVQRFLPSRKYLAVITGIIIAFNPISSYQLFTHYLDGQLALSLTCLILLLIKSLQAKSFFFFDHTILIPLLAAYVVSIKYTGLLFATLALIIYSISILYTKKLSAVKQLTISAGIALVLVLLSGFHPYITHVRYYDHPLFPLKGTVPLDMITEITPSGLIPFPTYSQFFISLFSKSRGAVDAAFEIKVPFTTTIEELKVFQNPDPRLGGLGPFFGGTLLFCILIHLYCLATKKTTSKTLLYGSVCIMIIAIITPASWCARYIGFLWLYPVFIMLQSTNKRVQQYLVCLLLANALTVSSINTYFQLKDSRIVKEQYSQLKNLAGDNSVLVDFRTFRSNRLRLENNQIAFQVVQKLDCTQPFHIKKHESVFCPPGIPATFEPAELKTSFSPYK